MIIKKFRGKTETEAIMAAKEEMGSGAIVMNIKTIKPKGIVRLFKKDVVEVTAALEEQKEESQKAEPKPYPSEIMEQKRMAEETADFERRLSSLQSMLEQQIKKEEMTEGKKEEGESEGKEKQPEENKEHMACLRLIYNQLIENEVQEIYANQIIGEVEKSLKRETPVDSILAAVYQRVILKLGEPETISVKDGKKKVIFFIGPTGVGKTTTIAKLASEMKLKQHAKLALIAADTYRIAAVEQLRTYANILSVPLSVVYTPDDLTDEIEKLRDYDLILIDTAGRSHKNEEHCEELFRLLDSVTEGGGFEKQVFLVLSVTTKYRDLERICKAYERVGVLHLIFTKLDETSGIGNILNTVMYTGEPLSYTTSGQNVPDDIKEADVQRIAKQLLGGTQR